MTTYYLNGSALVEGADFTINGFTYPYSWLEGTSPSVRASLGIEKQGDINYDERYYTGVGVPRPLEDREEVDENGNPVFVKVFDPTAGKDGEMVDTDKRVITKGLKTTCLAEIRNTTNQLLQPTDYYIIRNAAEQLEIPESVSTHRAAIVTESTRLQEAIPAVTTVEELIEVMSSANWPRTN